MADKDQNLNLDDRTSLGEDLEEYGVWVKAGPEDVDENEGESLFGLADLEEDGGVEVQEETLLTTEEEDLLADLEESDGGASDSLESLDLDSEELSLEGLDLPEPSFEEEKETPTIEDSIIAEDSVEETITIESEDFTDDGIEEMSIDSLDSLIEDEGIDVAGIPGSEQESLERIEVDEEISLTEDLPELEFEEEQPELEAEPTINEIEEPVSDDETIMAFDLETEELETEIASEEQLPYPESLEEQFDDVAAVEASMTEPTASFAPPQSGDTTVLETIEEELASIKTELHQLRAELAAFRGKEPAPSLPAEPAAPQSEESAEGVSGFFEEDEDETIALTGDELDNILNTAEFTEEAGKPSEYEEIDLSTEFEDSDILGEGEDLIPEGMELAEPDALSLEEIEDIPEVDEPVNDGSAGEIIVDDSLTDESPIEEITLEDIEAEIGDESDLELGSEEIPTLELPDENVLSGDENEIAALAEMDIESELSGIDELKDEPSIEEEEETIDIDLSEGVEEIPEVAVEASEPAVEAPEEVVDIDEPAVEIEMSEPVVEAEVASPDSLEVESLEIEEPVTEPLEIETAQPEGPGIPTDLKSEIRSVLSYMDQLLEALPEEKIEEFARSEHFEVYKRLFEELGLEQ